MDTAWQRLTGVETFTNCRALWVSRGKLNIITIECYNVRSST